MRTDLPLAAQAVQAAHAAVLGGRRFHPPDGCHLVLLAARSAGQVLAAAQAAERAGVRVAVFEDPDEAPAVTALCSQAVSHGQRRVFRRYALWGAADADGLNGRGRGPPSYWRLETPGAHLDF